MILSRILAYFTPKNLQFAKLTDLKQVKLAVSISILMVVLGIIYTPVFYWLFENPYTITGPSLLFLANLIVLHYFRVSGNKNILISGLIASIVIAQSINTFFTGGVRSPLITGFLILPLSAIFLAGIRSSIKWTIISGLAVILICVFPSGKLEYSKNFSEENYKYLYAMLYLTVIGILMSLIFIWIYVQNQNFHLQSNNLIEKIDIKKLESYLSQCISEKFYTDDSIRIETLAKRLGLSRHQLSAYLNEVKKTNFSKFIQKLRLIEAEHLLINYPEKKVIDVAFECGFNSVSAFYNAFFLKHSLSPQAYRLKNRETSLSDLT